MFAIQDIVLTNHGAHKVGTEKEIFKINKMEKSLCHSKDIAKKYSKQFSFC
jgi:hypothetical protein